jgi:hypothetical protein
MTRVLIQEKTRKVPLRCWGNKDTSEEEGPSWLSSGVALRATPSDPNGEPI